MSAMDLHVIKLGGSLLDDRDRRLRVLERVVGRWNAGQRIILVHGGGLHIDAALTKAGIARRTHAGLRITDAATLDIVVSVLCGTVNKMLVAELTTLGVSAAGLSGVDGGTLCADLHPPVDGIDLGHVGRVTESSPRLIRFVISAGTMPVVASVAMGPGGSMLNVNADSAAAAIASAAGASSLQFLTDVPGVYDQEGEVFPTLESTTARRMLDSTFVTGGMRPKLMAALSALDLGVPSITIGEEGGTAVVAA